MAESVSLLIFVLMLLSCVLLDISLVYALTGGLVVFSIYTLCQKYSVAQLLEMIWKGVRNSKTILLVFVLIGFLTALWRAAGTIPCIVAFSASTMAPKYYLALTFLLCCGMSALTGTSFGTASTMGVICAGIGKALDIPVIYTGGAVMSGIYFGEQCSPMSSSALLVCDLTGTNIYQNIGRVFRNILVPLGLTLALYLWLGRNWAATATEVDNSRIFAEAFHLNWMTIIPALLIVLCSLFRMNVIYIMLLSIVAAAMVCIFVQNVPVGALISHMLLGYRAENLEVARLLNGGGLLSMLDIGAIVAISSAYFGIFSSTNLLLHLKQWVGRMAERSNVVFATIVVSLITCAISCNQTLATMLSCEMTKPLNRDKETLALNLETTVIVIAGLIPWSIACAFPLSVVEAPLGSILYASYLYLVPLWMFLQESAVHIRNKKFGAENCCK